ncbi:MAG: sulfotransferase [Actinomycetota bacterium]|nr:sulfotransferase [Actinomycetota bacterium]
MLNAHPMVHITNEARVFAWAHHALKSLDHQQIALAERPEFESYLRRELAVLLRGYYRERWSHTSVWGDKNPHYAAPGHGDLLGTVVDLFPSARFIHVIRDGRDVVASLVQMRHPGGDPWTSFEEAHYVWNSHVTYARDFAINASPGTVLEVRYEELVADDLLLAERMCDFLGLECHSKVAQFCEEQQRGRTPLSDPTRDLSGGASHSDWERIVSERGRRDESLELLRENLIRFGYV